MPEISDTDAVRSAIGHGTNNFTTVGLALVSAREITPSVSPAVAAAGLKVEPGAVLCWVA